MACLPGAWHLHLGAPHPGRNKAVGPPKTHRRIYTPGWGRAERGTGRTILAQLSPSGRAHRDAAWFGLWCQPWCQQRETGPKDMRGGNPSGLHTLQMRKESTHDEMQKQGAFLSRWSVLHRARRTGLRGAYGRRDGLELSLI